MRVLRTILGMLLLTIGLPSLLAGAGLWAAMQHRDQGGAYSGELQRLATPGYAFVVEDVDALLRADAPFARIGRTRLSLTAATQDGPAFVGLAPSAEVSRYLAGVPHGTIRTVDIGTGTLPVETDAVGGRRAPVTLPAQETFWTRTGVGRLAWQPGDVRGGPYSLVVMNPGAEPGIQLRTVAELRPGWLNTATWALLVLGALLLMIGLIVLAWPAGRREIVYVVEPSQVPDLMRAIGAPLPLNRIGASRPAGAHRPRTLADAQRHQFPALPPATAQPAWPPPAPAPVPEPAMAIAPPSAEEYAAATAIPAGARSPAPGEPLSYIGTGSAAGPVSLPLGDPPHGNSAPLFGRPGRAGLGRPPEPNDLPLFQASAVGAWVAETAPARARETEAQAAARMAEAARNRAATGQPSSPASSSLPAAASPAAPCSSPAVPAAASSGRAPSPLPASAGRPGSSPVSAGRLGSSPAPGDEPASPASAGRLGSSPVSAGRPGTGPASSREPSPAGQPPSADVAVDAVAAAYAAGAADARAARGEVLPTAGGTRTAETDRPPSAAGLRASGS